MQMLTHKTIFSDSAEPQAEIPPETESECMTKEFISQFPPLVEKKGLKEKGAWRWRRILKRKERKKKEKKTHIFGDLQHGKNKEDVFMSVEQLLVLEVSVHLAVSERELGRQFFEERCDVGFRLSLSSETHTSTRSVDLSQKLMIEKR